MNQKKPNSSFQLLLCSTDLSLIKNSVEAGVDGVIVEWENVEGDRSVALTSDMILTLKRVRSVTDAWVICRLNPYYEGSKEELELAVATKADEIWLPKVKSVEEVRQILDWAKEKIEVSIVVETVEAMELSSQLAQLPLYRVHIGLNDLGESLHNAHPFYALSDGTVESILKNFTISSGFGGLTLPEKGHPISCRLLMGELVRLGCNFSLLRRSFIADIKGKILSEEIPKIKHSLDRIAKRSFEEIEIDRLEFARQIDLLLSR